MSVLLGPQYILPVLLVTNTIPGNLTKRSFISLALVLSKFPDPLIQLPSFSSSTAISIWFPKPLLLL